MKAETRVTGRRSAVRALTFLLAFSVLGACASDPSEVATIPQQSVPTTGASTVEDALRDRGSALGGSLGSLVTNDTGPAAVTNGGAVYYNSWLGASGTPTAPNPASPGTPVIRSFAPSTGLDQIVVKGAGSLALSVDDRLAFVRGATEQWKPEQGFRYPGSLVVKNLRTGTESVWADGPAEFRPVVWAGSTLLAYELDSRTGYVARTLVFREGALAGELNGLVSAVSPDGTGILLIAASEPNAFLKVVEARSGKIVASMTLASYVDAFVEDGDKAKVDTTRPINLDNLLPDPPDITAAWAGSRVYLPSPRGLRVITLSGGQLQATGTLSYPGIGVDEEVGTGEIRVFGNDVVQYVSVTRPSLGTPEPPPERIRSVEELRELEQRSIDRVRSSRSSRLYSCSSTCVDRTGDESTVRSFVAFANPSR